MEANGEKISNETNKESDSLRAKHLLDPADAIIACVGTSDDQIETLYEDYGDAFSRSTNVNFHAPPESLDERGVSNAGYETYAISSVDSRDKRSSGFVVCIGIVACGRDKETEENISFLAHQDPDYFLEDEAKKEKFLADLREKMNELARRSVSGTADVLIVGGKYLTNKNLGDMRRRYTDAVDLLSGEVKKVFGFDPVVIHGPKSVHGEDSLFFDNERRRLFVSVPEDGALARTGSFTVKDMSGNESEWKKAKPVWTVFDPEHD